MKPDLLTELRAADPAHEHTAAPEPDWDAIERRIVATPRRAERRRRVLVLVPIAAAAAAVAIAAVALMPGSAPPTVLERAYAAVSADAIYHYAATSQELEGPERRPLADTRSAREGWIDPATGEIHEISANGDEWASDGKRRAMYTAFNDALLRYEEPPAADESGPVTTDVLRALTRSFRAGALRDEGVETFDGRAVRRLVATNPTQTWRQTFLIDARTYLPVLFLHETGDYIREGTQIPPRQRVVEERYERFERLPANTERAVLEMRPHPGARPSQQPRPAIAPASG